MTNRGIRIAILGPESTGKTILAQSLASYYQSDWIKEIARGYIEDLGREYTYQDVEKIAKLSVEAYEKVKNDPKPIFFDTELIITKIWFEVVFGEIPEMMDHWMKEMEFDAYLLCLYDLPWQPDPVRENGGEMRKLLFYKYKTEIEKLKKPYHIVKGSGKERIKNAVNSLSELTTLPGWSETRWQDCNPEDLRQ